MIHTSLLLALFLSSLLAFSNAEISSKIGINYGRLGNKLPSPYQSIELIRNTKAGRVKIYDANPEILRLLSGTKLQVTIMVTNDQIPDIASRQASADKWVRENVLQYYPRTMIRFILVGNEVLSDNNTTTTAQLWPHLVPAMARIKNSLKAQNIKNIKVGTPLAMDILGSTFPPSSGAFRDDMLEVMVPLLHFLNRTTSFFFVDVYPYFPWSENPTGMSLDFALFQGVNLIYTDPVSGLNYTNLLDQMLDAVNFGMAKLGFNNLRLAISETGWPNSGDIDQPGANLYNAATYNRNLVKKMTAKPALGTPAKPGLVIPTFIFSLYNENQKGGPGTERHWGLFNPDGRALYELDLSGKRSSEMGYRQLPEPGNNLPYRGKIWCVVAEGVDSAELNSALLYACGEGNGTCSALAPGSECYEPVSEVAHASYAFSSYWAKFRSTGATCYFNGLAVQTTRDPSHGSCKFPSVTL